MPMHTVIQERRKALGLTQEQVAQHLNVSIPAVSKWERGTTCPDAALLPPLARLLKTDLNTLFCFHEKLTKQEISMFCREITDMAQTDGIPAAFEAAKQRLREYPHDETLLHCIALNLDGLLHVSGMSEEEQRPFDEVIEDWYCRLAESGDDAVSNSAAYMMVSRYIRKGAYDRAQETLDRMPDRNEVIRTMADKLLLQVTVLQHQGQTDRAAEDLERALLLAVNKVQLLLFKLVDAELKAGAHRTANQIAEKTRKVISLFDLWRYNADIAPLQIAVAEQNTDACIAILRNMLEAVRAPWNMGASPLFHRIAGTAAVRDQSQMLSAVLTELEHASEYAFLRECPAYHDLIGEYKTCFKES